MKLIDALLTHAWLAFSLKHDGTGMPRNLQAATALVSLYAFLTLANKHIVGGIDFETVAGICFIAMFYLFGLRNPLIGLILLISIINNALTLVLATVGGIPIENLGLVMVMEYIMIFAGMINIIKSNFGVTEP